MTVTQNNDNNNGGGLVIVVGRMYINRKGQHVFIKRALETNEPEYAEGYRFMDDREQRYTIDGRSDINRVGAATDLAGDWSMTDDVKAAADNAAAKTRGLFYRLTAKVRRNPVKSLVGAAVVGGVGGYAGYQYQANDNDDAVVVAAAAVSLLDKVFG